MKDFSIKLNRTEIYRAESYEHAMNLINALRSGSIKPLHILGHKVLEAKKHTLSIFCNKFSLYKSDDLGKYSDYIKAYQAKQA